MEAFVYETEKAIVRIHPGKLSDEERKVVLTNACERLFKAIQKTSGGDFGSGNHADRPSGVSDGV